MQNVLLAYPNRIDEATLSGGSWLTALPLTHLQTRILQRVARSASLDPADTQFAIDLGRGRTVQVLALANHNLSTTARYRLRASLTADFAWNPALEWENDDFWLGYFMTDWQYVWPYGVFDSLSLEWEDDHFWTGQLDAETRAAYTSTLIIVLPQQKYYRYWRLELDDPDNPAGYVQIGRMFIGPAWQPRINYNYGASLAWETATQVETSLGNVEYFDRREGRRVSRFTLSWLDEREAMEKAFELQRSQGLDREVVLVADPDDRRHAIRRNFLGRLRQLSPIEHPYYGYHQTAFELQELQ